MSSILYIGKDYCHTLEQLQDYFRCISSAQDALYNELLTLQRDGLIAQWLDEGDEREQEIANRIRNLTPELTNKELMESLTEILTNKNKNFNVNLHSYLELKEVSFALTESFSDEAIFNKIEDGKILNLKDEDINKTLRLKLKFKILKSEKEAFRLKTMLSLGQQTIHEKNTILCLDNDPVGKEKTLYLDIPALQWENENVFYSLDIYNEFQILFSTKVQIGIPEVFTINGVNFEMIKVEVGQTNKKMHNIKANVFYIGETVVTQALWKAVMNNNPSYFKGNDLPVESVSFNDTIGFLDKLNNLLKEQLYGKKFALPTEEQWEFAARGGNKSKGCEFSGSDEIGKVAWYEYNSNKRTHPVKGDEKIPNELAIYGMTGNVWEWCDSDWREYLNASPNTLYKIVRGGSWQNGEWRSRITYRDHHFSPFERRNDLGFRLILQ